MKKYILTSVLLGLMVAASNAETIVFIDPNNSGDITYSSLFTLDNSSTAATATVNVAADAPGGTPAFSFDLTLESLTSDNLNYSSNATSDFPSTGSGLMNAGGMGIRYTVSNISDADVQFDYFHSFTIGGNGGTDITRFTSGANTFTSDSTANIALGEGYVSPLEVEFIGTGGGIRISNTRLQFSAIPEPATLGLIAMFGGGILFIRRRFMM
ncbi:PEP-CTERM sorting domain-containing protein [Pontiellaceae bacterium B1224]|nr:PEP-CTERM sorting domain-containing protein [Pontiellaceae bacterium B1224]